MFPVYTRDGALLGHASIEFTEGYTLGEESLLLVGSCNDIEGKPPVNSHGEIYQGHPLRELVAGLSTSGLGGYYTTKGDFLAQLDKVLARWGITREDFSPAGDYGRVVFALYYHGEELTISVVVSWYKMQSGRYEFTCYLS